jgi:hypothetical protein
VNAARALPLAVIVLSAGAGVVYALTGDWRRGIYWLAAAVIGVVTTFWEPAMALTRTQIKKIPDESLLRRICEVSSEVIKAVCKHAARLARTRPGASRRAMRADYSTQARSRRVAFMTSTDLHRARFARFIRRGVLTNDFHMRHLLILRPEIIARLDR